MDIPHRDVLNESRLSPVQNIPTCGVTSQHGDTLTPYPRMSSLFSTNTPLKRQIPCTPVSYNMGGLNSPQFTVGSVWWDGTPSRRHRGYYSYTSVRGNIPTNPRRTVGLVYSVYRGSENTLPSDNTLTSCRRSLIPTSYDRYDS